MKDSNLKVVEYLSPAKDDETPEVCEFKYFPCKVRVVRFPTTRSVQNLAESRLTYQLLGAMFIVKEQNLNPIYNYYAIVKVIDGAKSDLCLYDASGFFWIAQPVVNFFNKTKKFVPGNLVAMKILSTLLECSDSKDAFRRVKNARANGDTLDMKVNRDGDGWTFTRSGNPIDFYHFIVEDRLHPIGDDLINLDWVDIWRGKHNPFPNTEQLISNELIEWLMIGDFSSVDSAKKSGYSEVEFLTSQDITKRNDERAGTLEHSPQSRD